MPIAPIALLKMDLAHELPKDTSLTASPAKGKFGSVLKAVSEKQEVQLPIASDKVQGVQTPIQVIVNSITKSEKSLNDIVSLGLSGKKFSTQQLLMMQAGVYKATIAIDVVSKGVEQTTGGLKTLLQSQV